MPAPKTPPDSLRTTFALTRPSAWPPRARRRRALPVRLTQAFRDCPGQVLSRRMPGVVGPSPLTPHGPPFGPVQDVPVEGTTAGGPSVTDGRIVSAGRSAVRLSRGSSPFAETREPVRGNSPPAVAARGLGSRPPIAAEVGRDRLTSVGREPTPRTASGGQNASGGGHLIGVPLRRTARPLVDHYPRAKSEDDAVGAPRLVLRRWDTTVVPRRVPPAPMQSKCPKGRGCVPRVGLPNGGSDRSGR